MARKKWPVLPNTSGQHVLEAARRLIAHCQAMESHARNRPQSNLQASAVEGFAKAANTVISVLLDDHMNCAQACDEALHLYRDWVKALNTVQEAKTKTLPASGTASVATPDVIPNQSSPSLSESSATDTSDSNLPTQEPIDDPDNDKRVRVHWDLIAPPYLHINPSTVTGEVEDAVSDALLNVHISRVQMLPSGDVDVYTSSRKGADILVAYSDRWIPDLREGNWGRVIDSRWSVMVHGVPRDWFSERSLTNGDAVQQIMLHNPHMFTACIPYVGWVEKGEAPKTPKFESVFIVSFDRPEDANALLRAGVLYLNNSTPRRVKRFAIEHQFKQCTKCQRFGHSTRQCTSLYNRCLYCAYDHYEKNCPKPTNICCFNCKGPHPANSKGCKRRKAALEKLRQLRKHKSRLYPETKPEPAPAPPAEGQAVPNLAKRPLPPDSTVAAIANSNDCLERPEKRRRPNHANVGDANLPATPRNPLSTLDQQTMNKPQVLDTPKYPPGSEYDFEDDYPSDPEYSETESELDLDISAIGDLAQQSTASDSEYTTESSSRGSP